MHIELAETESGAQPDRSSSVFLWIAALCALCQVMDGFDTQIIGYLAPALAAAWHVPPPQLGPVFSSGLVGMLLGASLLGASADRFGRRPIIIFATLLFSVFTLASVLASSPVELMAFRFVAGIGLGAVIPNTMALVGEFAPAEKRVTVMMLTSCGFVFGATVGGFISAIMLPRWGWQSPLYVGGFVPLVIALFMFFRLPESTLFLRAKTQPVDTTVTPVVANTPNGLLRPLTALFFKERRTGTLVIWSLFFLNMLTLFLTSSWLSTAFHMSHYSAFESTIFATAFQLGGVIGTIGFAILIRRYSFSRVLPFMLLVGASATALLGHAILQKEFALVACLTVVGGICVVGGQCVINALGAHYYPTAIRATGMGIALSVGRCGSIIGPLIGGELLKLSIPIDLVFIYVSGFLYLGCVLVFIFRRTIVPSYAEH